MLIWIDTPKHRPGPFLLLDRDGVINKDPSGYIRHRREFQFYPDALEALRWLREHLVRVIIISNQSGLNRGLIPWENFWDLHEWMIKGIRDAGGNVLGTCYCPHRPEEGCSCRKPSPGMIKAASEIFQIPLGETYFIGDRHDDLLAANNAGCRGILLDRSAEAFDHEQVARVIHTSPGNPSKESHGSNPTASTALTQHSALSTQHSLLSTQHSSLSTQHCFSPPINCFSNLMDAVLALSKTWEG